GPIPERFRRGEINLDDAIDLSDAVRLLLGLFAGAGIPCEDAADVNDDSRVDVSDPITLLGRLFLGRDALPGPTTCGADPTEDALTCATPYCSQ
ncbi:MAG: hypothetical protein AAF517_10380, partial [Planctomycetota bacterium]